MKKPHKNAPTAYHSKRAKLAAQAKSERKAHKTKGVWLMDAQE